MGRSVSSLENGMVFAMCLGDSHLVWYGSIGLNLLVWFPGWLRNLECRRCIYATV